jgi:ribonuclease HI
LWLLSQIKYTIIKKKYEILTNNYKRTIKLLSDISLMYKFTKDDHLKIYTDGASRKNPGDAAIGFIFIKNQENQPFKTYKEYIGKDTNNVAEYKAIIKSLIEASKITSDKITLYSDSELVIKQLNGLYQVKKEHLRSLYTEVLELIKKFKSVTFIHVQRSNSFIKIADQLCNDILDEVQRK